MELKDKKVLVFGTGLSGIGAAALLYKKGVEPVIYDGNVKTEPEQVKEITFTQKMSLQGGEYLLSLGVTGYNVDTFEVYHRLYDALNITVVSDKNTVGYYDMNSEVKVTDVTGQ